MEPVEKSLRVSSLKFDLRNPRIPETTFESEDEAILYLVDYADVEELVESIGNSGWLEFEPLIVLNDGTGTVLEGNRRLAALRILRDKRIQQLTGVPIPDRVHPGATPETVKVLLVESRQVARDYIGFKHINGAFKWDALAKARYAWEWLNEDTDATIELVSSRLGDKHRTVSRMVNGYSVLIQAEQNGFDRGQIDKRSFYFSHLYTSLATPAVREYLSLRGSSVELLGANPVPKEKLQNLQRYMGWLYGQKGEPALVRSQNPDLNRLVAVLGNDSATRVLESTRDLVEAHDMVEDKGARFTSALYALNRDVKNLASQVGSYDGEQESLETMRSMEKTVKFIRSSMESEATDAESK